jgi:hypothetical protein
MEGGDGSRDIRHDTAFRQFKPQVLGSDPGLLDDFGDHPDKISLLKLTRRKIHGDVV